ncbi:hypothetical protein PV325_013730 [Microctonus aethiopoides]|nr:hypothetical protein PV325_013730 [Microctonus aethiopoides]
MDCYVGDIEELPYILVSQIESKQVIIITNDTSHISPTQMNPSAEFDSSNELWNIVWRTFENASLTYDLAASGNGTKINNYDNEFFENPIRLGIFTGLFLAWLAEIQIIPIKFDYSIEVITQRFFFALFNFSCFILLVPIIVPLLICFFIYRRVIHIILKISMGKKYAGLLEGTDCVWAVEDSTSLSVINVLAVLEIAENSSKINLVEDFRNLVKDRLISLDFDKLFWLKEKKYGYYYWRKCDWIDLKEHVRWLDDDYDHKNCNGTCNDISERCLKNIIARTCNKPLPKNHSACWEILIPKKCPKSYTVDNCKLKKNFPLLFRVHHALGDGVALLRLLLEVIADSKNTIDYLNKRQLSLSINQERSIKLNDENNQHVIRLPILRKSSSLYGNYRASTDIIYYSSDLLGASMPFSKIIYLQIIFESLKKYLRELGRRIVALVLMPSHLIYQSLRSLDNSAIHGPALSGDKIISYWMEDDTKRTESYSLLEKIRDIKNVTGTRFGDVILAALSANLNNYFLQMEKASPKLITVVIPGRMTFPNQKLTLNNRFSVGLLPLYISEVDGACDNNSSRDSSKILDRLRAVSASSDELKNNPDYIINFWVMKWLCAGLPECFLRPLLKSTSTMIFSNLPGPQTVKISRHTLKKIAFWIPHRGTTGIGFSFLTYGGNVNFSVIADKAVINNENALNQIIKGTIDNIEQLHASITLPCYKK